MKRRILSIVLGIAMLVGLLPVTALAGEVSATEASWVFGVAGIEPDYTDAATGTLKEAFAAANANSEVTYVRLNGDVTSTNETYPFQLVSNKSMVLDMNGKSITATCTSDTVYGIYTNIGSSLTVKDGTIIAEQTGSSSAYGIYARGELTVENCTVEAKSSNYRAFGISTYYANANISGGSISAQTESESSYAYGVESSYGNVKLSNTPAIMGTTVDIYYPSTSSYKVVFANNMNAPTTPYRIKSGSNNSVFTSGAYLCNINANNFSNYFVSADNKKEVVYESGELKLVNKPYVSFYTGSGTTIERIYLPYSGGTATRPAEPTWEGYTFAGWYADDAYTNMFDFDQTLTQDTRVYAKWTFAATQAEPKDSEPLNGIYGSTLDELIEATLSKLSIKVIGGNGTSLSGLYTDDWTVKDGQDLAGAQPGDTVTFVGKLTAPTGTNYDAFYNNNDRWYGRLPQWEGDLAVEADVVLDYYVKAANYTYTTNPDGIMAYRTTDEVFDIRGYFGGEWKQTSFKNGYETYLKVGETTEQIKLRDGGYSTSSGLNVDIGFDFLNNGQTLQIKYKVADSRGEGEPIAFSLGSGTDIQIGYDDGAIITELLNNSGTVTGFMMKSFKDADKDSVTGEYAQFNFFGKGYAGVTDISDFWYGAYSKSYDEEYYWINNEDKAVFFSNENNLSGTEYGKYLDSAATWHWDDSIEAGETKTYSILIGIGGAGSENAAQGGGLTEPTGSVTIELSEDLTASSQLVIKLGENTLIEGTHYTIDLATPDKPIITFTEAAGLNVSSGDLTVTITFVDQETEDVTITNSIPGTGNVSTEDGAMEDVTAEGLDDLAKGEKKDIILIVKEEVQNATDNEHSAINAEAGEKTVEFLDITLMDKNDKTPITEISKLLEISIPFDVEGKSDITVYRYHAGVAETMEKDPESGDEGFKVEEDSITIYTKKFSTYAIGYTLDDSSGDDPVADNSSGNSSNRKPKYDVKYEAANTENGTVEISCSRAAKGKTVTIEMNPDEGYQLDELVILDKNGSEVEYKDNGDGTFTFVMPRGEVEIWTSFAEIEKEQLILVFTIDEKKYLKNHAEQLNDVAPVIRNDRTMLPIRVVAENLGAKVVWNEADQSVTITMNDKEIVIYVGQMFALVDGDPVVQDSPAFIADNRTYLPMRFVAENLSATVIWDDVDRMVTIID